MEIPSVKYKGSEMGFFSKLFDREEDEFAPLKKMSVAQLIGYLGVWRIEKYPLGKNLGISRETVVAISVPEIYALPEATIVSIVQQYDSVHKKCVITNKDVTESEILRVVEEVRCLKEPRGQLPDPLTLPSFIKYRLAMEHPDATSVADVFIEFDVAMAQGYFR